MSSDATAPHDRPVHLPVDPSRLADHPLLWLFFGGGAFASALLSFAYAVGETAGSSWQRAVLVGTCAALAVAFVVASRVALAGRVAGAVLAASWLTLAVGSVVALALGAGVRALPLSFVGIVICMACVLCSVRAGLALLAGGALVLVLLLGIELHGALPPSAGVAGGFGGGLASAFLTQQLLLAIGFVAGLASRRTLGSAFDAAAERERRFRGLLDIAADWTWEQDAQLRFTAVSPRVLQYAGIPAAAYIGRRRWEVPGLALDESQWEAHRADLDARRPFRDLVIERRDAEGQPRFVSISGEPLFDAGGRFRGYWGVGRDVTPTLLAQRALAASEERYRELFARTPSPLVLHRRGIVIDANEAALELLGYLRLSDMVGVDMSSHHLPGELVHARRRIASLDTLPIGTALPLAEFSLGRVDGKRVVVQVTSMKVALGDAPATLSIYIDITARKTAEQALKHSQTLLQRLFETTPDTVSLTEMATGRFLMLNQHYTEVLGWTAEDAIGRNTADLRIWVDPADRERLLLAVAEQGTVRDMAALFRHKDGRIVPLRVSAARFTADGVDYLVVVGRDVSSSEQARLEREAILQHASIGIAFTRGQRFVHVNPRFEEMLGWPAGALVGQPGSVVWPTDADYAEVSAQAGPLLAAGQRFEIERPLRRRDGSQFWARIMAQVVDPRDPSRGGTIWIGEDITARRQVDQALAAARDAAEAASRAKSAFLANTSHEIRTPLNGLLGLARLAQREDLPAGRRRHYLREIHSSARSLAAVMSDILDLSKIEAGKLSLESLAFDVREMLREVARGYRALAEERGLTLALHIDPSLPSAVSGDPVRVRQILGNFVSNALKFTRAGSVRIELQPAAEAGRVVLSVFDTGPGIDAGTQDRLFRPFTQADESTTRRFGGTGLGLSICRELATLMGGAVGVESAPGEGSRFWAELPLPAAPVTPAETLQHDDQVLVRRLAGARVLVVEDNPVNMLITCAMLEEWGVEVTEAADGRQAIEAVDRAEEAAMPYHAVLMDVQMPVMSGHEAARELRQRYATDELPIIALTAAALVSERDQALDAGMDAFLTKPIDAVQLQAALAKALKGTRNTV